MSTRWWKVPLVALLALLIVSQVLTDRLPALQVLWWIPRVLLAAPLVAGFAVLLACAMRWRWGAVEVKRLRVWLGISVAAALICVASDWGLPRVRPDGGFRLAHWNACYPERQDARYAVDTILGFDADAVVITDPGLTFVDDGIERLRAAGYGVLRAGSFAIVARVPVLEALPKFDSRERHLTQFALDTKFGRLWIHAVDMPSSPTLPRYPLVRSLVAETAALAIEPADIIVGDFNITRGSASLKLLTGDAREAFATAGTGWGGTYPRRFPLWGIDLMHVRAPWVALRSEIVDPGFGRHRAQIVDLTKG